MIHRITARVLFQILVARFRDQVFPIASADVVFPIELHTEQAVGALKTGTRFTCLGMDPCIESSKLVPEPFPFVQSGPTERLHHKGNVFLGILHSRFSLVRRLLS